MNKNIFSSQGVSVSKADLVNEAGGKAYSRTKEAALTQLVLTGCFNNTYYVKEEDQVTKILDLAKECSPEFVAKLAVYGRKHGFMKDTPAFLAAYISTKSPRLLTKIFSKVVDSPKMVRNFVQVLRSGVVGRKSLGSLPKRLVKEYLTNLTPEQLFRADVGNSPSLQDIILMTHPKAKDEAQNAMFGYLLDKKYNADLLPESVKQYEAFKKNPSGEVPDVPFLLLTALSLTTEQWKDIASRMTWQQLRQNLNTLERNNVLSDLKIVSILADKLKDEDLIKKSNVFPYQLYSAFKNVNDKMPSKITNALQLAAEHSLKNIPEIDGKVYIFPDVSGSMSSAVTGNRGSVTSKMRCIDVAGLMASAFLRKNPDAEVIPFENSIVPSSRFKLNPMDSIMTNADKLASVHGGGTNCSAPLAYLNDRKAMGDLCIYISDNESWADRGYGASTGMMKEWETFKKRNPKAKLVCIDITPSSSVQARGKEVLNVGGFSDQVFNVISQFVKYGANEDALLKIVDESISF